ncbi:MAG: DNA polymerase IV [Eubacteriales bacterium]|nr:DNA polymerase IV [Eubacteriales bacterium]MDD4474568.1 DNA polymerase IV [Eubacteriales bacterium]
MDRVVLHSDLNNFYASVECIGRDDLKGLPVAVVGDPERRHGIILAKNNLAKGFGVKTGEPLWKAKQKCPKIIFLKPNYDKYMYFSKKAREIYCDYTDMVEPFGADECWIELTGGIGKYSDGPAIADEIRGRIKKELEITASVGVSFNKLFAKLGSDMKKPDATTVITESNFRQKVWPLPAEDMLFIGRATRDRLRKFGITTIGGIANSSLDFLQSMFGKNGVTMWGFANGLDTSPVARVGAEPLIKSIGNGTTATRDLTSDDDVKITLCILCESVSARLRAQNFVCRTVQLGVRDKYLETYERQCPLDPPSRTAKELFDKAYYLFKKNHTSGIPVRSLYVRAGGLSIPLEQLSLEGMEPRAQRYESLESTIDRLRSKFGEKIISRAITMTDPALSTLDEAGEGVLRPEVLLKV